MTTNLKRAVRKRSASPDGQILRSEYRLQFAACYVYSPKGQSEVSQQSRQLCARVKSGSVKWLNHYVTDVHHEVTENSRFEGYFDENTILVPIPDYRPGSRTSFWLARRLALELRIAGLAEEVWTGLRRVSSVERSSSAWMWERPSVEQHYASFAVTSSTIRPKHIVLVDDVITKGRTLVAAAMRLQEAFPEAQIQAFALVRTMGFVPDVTKLFDPCQGEVHWNGRDAYRNP